MKISVITTLFNYSEYIKKAALSFLNQNFTDSEMVIVDDGSTDDPMRALSDLLSDRVRYIRLDKNFGYSHAKNVGIKNSRSEVLVMLDADDMLTENSLKNRFVEIERGFDFVHGPALNLKDGQTSISSLWKQWKNSSKDAKSYRYVHAQGVMLRKDVHRKIGLYDENLKCKSDREMWARIFNHGFKIGTVETPVVIYRNHKKQMSRSKEKLKINDQLQENVLKLIESRKTNLSDVEML